jgi:hypothetical protein
VHPKKAIIEAAMTYDRIRELSGRSEALYCKLRSNDPETSSIDVAELGPGCGPALGQALTSNTHVLSIDIHVGRLATPHIFDPTYARIAPFLECLRNSPSLRHVTLRASGARAPFMNLVFGALAQNRRLLSLQMDHLHTTPGDFSPFLQTTTSLKTLRMGWLSIPLHQAQLFIDAFNANQSLEELELAEDGQSVDWILYQIGSHPRLRSLVLRAAHRQESPCARLPDFLCRTTVLQDLSLDGYQYNEGEMTHLLAALLSNRSITRLRLGRYWLTGTASSLFSRFVRHKCNQGSNKIREVHLEPHDYDRRQMNPAMLLPSSVDVLTIQESHHYRFSVTESFFNELTTHSTRYSNIPCLRISFNRPIGIDAMIRFLPTTTSLRELVIFGDGQNFLRTAVFRKALQKNGSIISFTVEPSKGTLVDDTVLLNLRAFGDRNRMVPELLKPVDSQSLTSMSCLTLFPSLFSVAQQAPRTAPNAILMGLLAAECDSVGFSTRRDIRMKRKRDAS